MFCPNCGKENDDAVRHCQSCGSFIPDLSVLGDTTPAVPNNQPLTYQALSQDNFREMQQDTSRYQEYTMSDVVAKKNHKKLIVWLIVIASVIVLGVAAFFAVRWIIGAVTLGKIKDDPTKYVISSYQTTAQHMADSSDLVRSLTAHQGKQETTKVTVSGNGMTSQQIMSVDGDNKRAYFYQSTSFDPSYFATLPLGGKKRLEGEPDPSVPQNMEVEGYATMDRVVLKGTQGDKTADYYLDLNNLRQDALTSAFGPKGENVLHLRQEDYDMAMDVYEFVYNNLKQEGDPFGLMSLVNQICDDFDKCGNINVSEEKAAIDDASVDAIVVTHTFNNTDVVKAVFNDLKAWIKEHVNINENINNMIDSGLAKINIDGTLEGLNSSGQLDGVALSFKHYINKNNALMQTEICLDKNGQTLRLLVCFGADPTSSKKISIKAGTVDANGKEMIAQTINVTDEGNAEEEKYVISYIGFGLNGSTTFTRHKTTGDFTLSNDMTAPFAGGMTSDITGDMPIDGSVMDPKHFTMSGNLKTTEDSVTLTYRQPAYDGTEIQTTCTVFSKAEIKELTSNNNLLTATSQELMQNFGFLTGGNLASVISNMQ